MGEEVLLLRWRHDLPVRVPVTVEEVNWGRSEKDPGGRSIDGGIAPTSYYVASGNGGGVHVYPEELAPGGALDRIVVALEDSEISDELSSGPGQTG